jgi:hypothetical protein
MMTHPDPQETWDATDTATRCTHCGAPIRALPLAPDAEAWCEACTTREVGAWRDVVMARVIAPNCILTQQGHPSVSS